MRIVNLHKRLVLPMLLLALPRISIAQDAGGGTLSLSAAVADAEKNYPSIQISQDDLNASAANIALARTAYLPRLDGVAQFNRGTRNNVFGSLLPQSIIPPMSGPVIGTNNSGSVWGSATGLLINWQPFDFGMRSARVRAAVAAKDQASAANQRTQLEVATASADAYLTVLAAMSTKRAASAAIDNWEILRTSIHALVSSQLRPGADESRIDAEKAAAVTELALADQAIANSEATLQRFLTGPIPRVLAEGKFLSEIPAVADMDAPLVLTDNPVMSERHAAVEQNASQLRSLERSWTPQFNLEAAAYARGTGAETNGQRLSGVGGLAPNVSNYVAGVNVTFPFMEFASIHAREAAQAATLRSAKANEILTDKTLHEQFAQAQASLRATQTIAQNTPIQRGAAQTTLNQATARYKAGLVPIDDVAQAQRLLVQAQIDDAIARLNVWRSYLHVEFIRGDIQPFLQEANR
jgi:outer membrane protein TolC